MANHKSAKKRIRQTVKRSTNNKWKNSRIRSTVKKFKTAVTDSNKEEAIKLLPQIQALYAKLAKTPGMKKSTASRRTSRLAKELSTITK